MSGRPGAIASGILLWSIDDGRAVESSQPPDLEQVAAGGDHQYFAFIERRAADLGGQDSGRGCQAAGPSHFAEAQQHIGGFADRAAGDEPSSTRCGFDESVVDQQLQCLAECETADVESFAEVTLGR